MELVRTMATRMGFGPDDVEILVDLVRHHLLLPDTATRRDLDDPTTVSNVARAAGNQVTLHLLGALDRSRQPGHRPLGLGTVEGRTGGGAGPRADRALAGEARPAGPRPLPTAYRVLMDEVHASGLPSVSLDPPRVVVAAPDRPGLLSAVAGVLALHGMDVRAANVAGEGGVAVEVFTVEVARGTWPDTARLREDLAAVLVADPTALAERLSARGRVYPAPRRSAAHLPGADVRVDNDASESATVLEVRAPDEVGLLHRITRVLFEASLDVVSARVSTLGELVVDAFYVREAEGAKVTDPDRLSQIIAADLGLPACLRCQTHW